jgi:hypothetical protein
VLSLLQLARQGSLVGSTCESVSLPFINTLHGSAAPQKYIPYTDHAISWVNARQVDFANELDSGWLIGILVAAVHLEGVDSVLVDALRKHLSVLLYPKGVCGRTWGGPSIVPFQFDINRSSPSARP